MYMTEEEICKNYREAKDKLEQITILSQLNLCSKQTIRRILTKHDCIKTRDDEDTKNMKEEHELVLYQYKKIKKLMSLSDDEIISKMLFHLTSAVALLQARESKNIVRFAEDYRKDGTVKRMFPVESHYIYCDPKDPSDTDLFIEDFTKMCHGRA